MRTILIIDDEPAARYGMRRALEGSCRIVEAGSAREAREYISKTSGRPEATAKNDAGVGAGGEARDFISKSGRSQDASGAGVGRADTSLHGDSGDLPNGNSGNIPVQGNGADLILLDLVMPGDDGLVFLRWLRERGDKTPVLIVSALDTARTAVEALHGGAMDYIVKGFDIEELRNRAGNLLKMGELGAENEKLRRELVAEGQFGRMLGQSAAMRRVFEMADRVAPTDATVLILGESGTGKDLLAQEIHARSPRAAKAFVAVNCAALPENLIESELFGYEKGAFTGAAQQRKGKFEMASGGTLFLDEIGDMNPVTQAKVLRALESRRIERLGGGQSVDVDVRVVSATHRDLAAEIAAGRFREDLYYRLRVVTLELPPLRAHKEDLPLLAETFCAQLGARHGRNARLGAEAMDLMRRYDWPGNVRELRNALERTLVLSKGEEIAGADLPEEVRRNTGAVGALRDGGDNSFLSEADFREARRKFEIAYLKRKLEEHHRNVSQTAAEIGLQRQSLQEKLRELGIQRPGK